MPNNKKELYNLPSKYQRGDTNMEQNQVNPEVNQNSQTAANNQQNTTPAQPGLGLKGSILKPQSKKIKKSMKKL